MSKFGINHLIIPDTQVTPGISLDHFRWIGRYIAAKQPEKIIHLGDHFDLEALSSYDEGKACAEGRRLQNDLGAGFKARDILDNEIAKCRGYNPQKFALGGNHEFRLLRHVDAHPALEGMFGWHSFGWQENGWNFSEFLQPIELDGILYSHFFPHNNKGKILQTKNGAPSAFTQAQRQGQSATAGHQQGIDIAPFNTARGPQWGLIAGSCYTHNPKYLGPPKLQRYWRGVVMKHNVKSGNYSPCFVPLSYLKARYG